MECCECGRSIPAGELYLSVDYHLERHDGDDVVTVEEAESMLMTCFDHTPSRAALTQALKAAGLPAR